MRSDKTKFYVYAYLRSEDTEHGKMGQPTYIGKGNGNRAYNRERRIKPPENPALIVFPGQNLTEDEAFELERTLISVYGRIDLGTGCLGNLTDGGEGISNPSTESRSRMSAKAKREWEEKRANGYKYPPVSDETRAKFRDAKLGKTLTPEHRKKIGDSNRGKQVSPETIAKIVAKTRGQKRSPEICERISDIQKGRKQTPESIKKRADARRGKALSEETKAKISAANRGRKRTPEQNERNRAARTGQIQSPETLAKRSATMKATIKAKREAATCLE